MDCSPPGSSVRGILQVRILEWVAFPFSRSSFRPRDQTQVSCIAGRFFTNWAMREGSLWPYFQLQTAHMLSRVPLFATLWTVACQAPPSLVFSRQGYWSGLPFPFVGDLPNPGIEPTSLVLPALQVDSLPISPPGKPWPYLEGTKYCAFLLLHPWGEDLYLGTGSNMLKDYTCPTSLVPLGPLGMMAVLLMDSNWHSQPSQPSITRKDHRIFCFIEGINDA